MGGVGVEAGLGNKLFDYFASGLPVVFAGDGDAAAFISESGAGFAVPPGDDEAFANALRRLHENAALRVELGERGRRHVIANYGRAALLAPLERSLSRLVASERL